MCFFASDFTERQGCAILLTMRTPRFAIALSYLLWVFVCASPVIAQQTPQAAPSASPATPAATATVSSSPAAGTPAPAAPDGAPAITVKVKEVNLLAVVHDKKGQAVSGLDKQEFILEQDGRAQTITQFGHEGDMPLTIGLLADTGPSQRKALADERKAGTDFVNHLLRENKDKGFVLHFDKEVELLQDVTASHDKLAKGIDQISAGEMPAQRGRGGKRDDGDSQTPHFFFGGGMLYDAIFLSSDEVLKGAQGRKAIVLFSDGVDHDSKTSLERAIEAAQRADTIVYCVYVAPEREEEPVQNGGGRRAGGGYPGGGGPFPGGSGPFPGGNGGPFPGGGGGQRRGPDSTSHENKTDGKKILQQIASETGGRYFELSKKLTAAEIYGQIQSEMGHQYSLSYTPDKAGNGYHKLHLGTRNTELKVQTRAGFYAD